MFNSLSGTITGKFPRQLFIDTHGIEWDVCVPDKCLEEFPPAGNQGKVYTYMNHYENGMDLYGFATLEERNLFLDLLKVDGIGPKAAVKIMSSVSVKELIQVLESGEVAVLEKIPGVGKKTAAKMMLSLKGKLTIPETETVHIPKNSAYSVVVNSLCDMGYERQLAEKIVSETVTNLSKADGFHKKTQTEKEDAVFRTALMEMAR